jgi:hypothetical protein
MRGSRRFQAGESLFSCSVQPYKSTMWCKRNTVGSMKDAFLPQVRVESELRADLEAVLHNKMT